MEQFGITGHPVNESQWPHRVCVGPAWFDRVSKRLSVKADLLIYSNCVTVSGQCLSVDIIISISILVCTWPVFPNPVTYIQITD